MSGRALAALAQPGRREAADEQQQAEPAGEQRQHADATHDAGVAHLHAEPVVAVERVARAHRQQARHAHARGGLQPARLKQRLSQVFMRWKMIGGRVPAR